MKKIAFLFITLLFLISFVHNGVAYIPTAEKVLVHITQLNRHLTTLKVQATTTLFDEGYPEGQAEVVEQFYMKKGGLFRSERHTSTGKDLVLHNGRKTVATVTSLLDTPCRTIETVLSTLLFQKSLDNFLDDLSRLGVELHVITFDRIGQDIAYVIGNRSDGITGSHVWIDKARGVPLRFVGFISAGEDRVALRADYKEYTRVQKRFVLPQKIEYYKNDVLYATSVIDRYIPNVDMVDSMFNISERDNSYVPLNTFVNLKE